MMGPESEMSLAIAARLPGRVRAVFGPELCPVDGAYAILQHRTDSFTQPRANTVVFHVAKVCDIARFFTLRVRMPLLPAGSRWKRNAADAIFDNYEVVLGGLTVTQVSLKKNNAMCRARDSWPSFNNDPDNITDPSTEQWTITIPIDTRLVCPLVKLGWHDYSLYFNGWAKTYLDLVDGGHPAHTACWDGRISFEYQGVIITDRASRAACCNATSHTVPDPPKEYIRVNSVLHKEEDIFKRDLLGGKNTTALLLNDPKFSGCLTHVILAYTPYKPVAASCHPIKNLTVIFKGQMICNYDHVELEELNWVRCGALSPLAECKGEATHETFLYLVPFCNDTFDEYPTSWLYLAHDMSLEFRFWSDKGVPEGSLHVLTQRLNILKYATGMGGVKYA